MGITQALFHVRHVVLKIWQDGSKRDTFKSRDLSTPFLLENATFVPKKCIICLHQFQLMKFTFDGAHFGLHSFSSSIQY